MFAQLMHWGILSKVILNTALVSIPEELYLVMFTLLMLGEFDYWGEEECHELFDRWDYIRILIPTLSAAVISNVLRYGGANEVVVFSVFFAVLFLSIVFTSDLWGDAGVLKWISKAFLFLLLGVIILFIVEESYIPFIISATGKSIEYINNDVLLNFLVSIPERIIEYSILIFFGARKRTFLRANIIKPIIESKILMVLTISALIFNLGFLFVTAKIIGFNRALIHFSFSAQLIITLCIILFPIINLSILIWSIYYQANREVTTKKLVSVQISNLLDDITSYTTNEDYDNIRWKLNGINNEFRDIAEKLYPSNKQK